MYRSLTRGCRLALQSKQNVQPRPPLRLWVSLSQRKTKAYFPNKEQNSRKTLCVFIKIPIIARSKGALTKRGRCLISELAG